MYIVHVHTYMYTIYIPVKPYFKSWSVHVCIGYYTPASALSGIHALSPRAEGTRAWYVCTGYCTSGGCNMVFISYFSYTAHAL